MDRVQTISVIIDCVRDYQQALGKDSQTPIEPATPLLGRNGILDSMGLVSVVVAIEQKLNDDHGAEITLMDDRAMSQPRSPFRNAEAMADYILMLHADRQKE
jgi:acyl carrier protein